MNRKLTIGLAALMMGGWATAQELQIPPDDAVVAERGGVPVTVGDLRAKLRASSPKQARDGYFSDATKTGVLIDGQLLTRQIVAEARANGLDKEPAIQQEIESGIAELLARRQIERHMASLQEPDLEVLARERYIANKGEYMKPASADVRHILILTSNKSEVEARAKADKVHELLKAGGDFDAIFVEYSEDPNKAEQGWVRQVEREGFDPAFVDATEKLQNPGDISEPVLSRFGFHVIRLEEVTPARQRTFDEVKHVIVDQVRNEFRAASKDAYLASFSAKPLKMHDKVIQKLPNITEP